MKILAISKEPNPVDWENKEAILQDEAKEAYELYISGRVREIYFTEEYNAVLILEAGDLAEAREVINLLPLVKAKLLEFDLMELNPYTGYSRLIK
ncbi:MAG: superoxide dismutase [Bacteroidetes bacterium]|nr:superoxide dismutase [Bacteroidota bacterium]